MQVTKELILHEDVSIQVTVKDYYLVTSVYLIVQTVVRDQNREIKIKIEEPYERLMNHILDCKQYGSVVRK